MEIDRYLFRGKRTDRKECWEYGYLKIDGFYMDNFFIDDRYGNHSSVIPETVGQSTGLRDKNGRLIFEGDIVEVPSFNGGTYKTTVRYKDGKFGVDSLNHSFEDVACRNVVVTGNIYDK